MSCNFRMVREHKSYNVEKMVAWLNKETLDSVASVNEEFHGN